MNKIWWVVIFILVATVTYIFLRKTIPAPEPESTWENPTTEPYLKGPGGPPPAN